jgi:type I restriction enzyme, S subunit
MELIPKGYQRTEVGVIPEDWEVKALVNCCSKIVVGFVGICEPFYTSEGQGVLLIRTGNLKGNKLVLEDVKYVSREFHDLNKKSQVFPGDILIARHGSSGTAVQVPLDIEEANTLNIAVIKTNPQLVTSEFAGYIINSPVVRKQVISATAGSTQGVINTSELAKLLLPLPPTKAEQTAIATALSDVDALIAGLEAVIAKQRAIQEGAMQELLSGKRRLPGFMGEWEEKEFGKLARRRKEKHNPAKSLSQEFCVELEHIESNSGRLIGHTETEKASSLKTVFKKNDVLFGRLRAYLKKYWFASRDGVCSTEIWVLEPSDETVISEFLFWLVQTDDFMASATESYGTHMPRTDWSAVAHLAIVIPKTIEEQSAIAQVLTDMDSALAAQEAKLSKARALKTGMMAELLTGRVRLV